MALFKTQYKIKECPSCGNQKFFDHNDFKPGYHCGYCGKDFDDDGNEIVPLPDQLYICPRCGKMTCYREDLKNKECTYCGFENLIQTEFSGKQYWHFIDSCSNGKEGKIKIFNQMMFQKYVENSEHFDSVRYEYRLEDEQKEQERREVKETSNNSTPSPSTPQIHCPTCGSTNVKRISAASKVAGAYAFGLFSKTAKSQFKCGDCGYKW